MLELALTFLAYAVVGYICMLALVIVVTLCFFLWWCKKKAA